MLIQKYNMSLSMSSRIMLEGRAHCSVCLCPQLALAVHSLWRIHMWDAGRRWISYHTQALSGCANSQIPKLGMAVSVPLKVLGPRRQFLWYNIDHQEKNAFLAVLK